MTSSKEVWGVWRLQQSRSATPLFAGTRDEAMTWAKEHHSDHGPLHVRITNASLYESMYNEARQALAKVQGLLLESGNGQLELGLARAAALKVIDDALQHRRN